MPIVNVLQILLDAGVNKEATDEVPADVAVRNAIIVSLIAVHTVGTVADQSLTYVALKPFGLHCSRPALFL